MKFHWGTGLFTFYGLFVLTFLIILYYASQSKTDLVSETYYEDEIRYQEIIDKRKNAAQLSENVIINYQNGKLEILFPDNIKTINAIIKLVRMSDKNLDRRYTTAEHNFVVPNQDLVKGVYQVQVDWKGDGKAYYIEENVYIQ